eukprot:767258-Hanusia_phi.AAC.6
MQHLSVVASALPSSSRLPHTPASPPGARHKECRILILKPTCLPPGRRPRRRRARCAGSRHAPPRSDSIVGHCRIKSNFVCRVEISNRMNNHHLEGEGIEGSLGRIKDLDSEPLNNWHHLEGGLETIHRHLEHGFTGPSREPLVKPETRR